MVIYSQQQISSIEPFGFTLGLSLLGYDRMGLDLAVPVRLVWPSIFMPSTGANNNSIEHSNIPMGNKNLKLKLGLDVKEKKMVKKKPRIEWIKKKYRIGWFWCISVHRIYENVRFGIIGIRIMAWKHHYWQKTRE